MCPLEPAAGANVLTGDEVARLTGPLEKFDKATSTPIAVAIYRRAPAGSIEDFTIRIADRSCLGRNDLDNGAILFLFMDERAARLEVGYGLEDTLTDVQAQRILEADLAPVFARGAGNLLVRRPLATCMERVDISEVWDEFKILVWVLAGIIPAAGVVIIAAGGTFGGAGALIHW